MRNPYTQVALTYLRRPFSSWKIGILFIAVFLLAILGSHVAGRHEHLRYPPAPMSAQEAAMMQRVQEIVSSRESMMMHISVLMELLAFESLFVVLAVHVKGQFVDSRAHLMPGFRRIHATIAGVAALLCAVFLPAAFAWLVGWSSAGFVAITVLLFGILLWGVLSMAPWIILPALFAWFLFINPLGPPYARELVSGERPGQAAAILAIGTMLTLLGGIRLFRLNEDMPEYRWLRWNSATGKIEATGPRVAQDSIIQRPTQWVTEKLMAGVTRHAHRASISRWSRVCRWQVGMITGWPVFCFCLLYFFVFCCLAWIVNRSTPGSIALAVLPVSGLPAVLAAGTLLRRRKLALSRESLMCVDRATYLKQVGMTAALSQLQMWLGPTAVFVFWYRLVAQQPLSATVASVLALSALSQPWFFGLGIWLLRFRSPILFFLGWGVSFHALMVAMIGTELAPVLIFQRSVVLPAAAIFAVLGLILTWHAYRRWLVTDFD